ncbi:hypothetical protein TWF281_009021 [Arthrobotrys megalospora]
MLNKSHIPIFSPLAEYLIRQGHENVLIESRAPEDRRNSLDWEYGPEHEPEPEPEFAESQKASELHQVFMFLTAHDIMDILVVNAPLPNLGGRGIRPYRHTCPEADIKDTCTIKYHKVDLFMYGIYQLETFTFPALKPDESAADHWLVARPAMYPAIPESSHWGTMNIAVFEAYLLSQVSDIDYEPPENWEFVIFTLHRYFKLKWSGHYERTWVQGRMDRATETSEGGDFWSIGPFYPSRFPSEDWELVTESSI